MTLTTGSANAQKLSDALASAYSNNPSLNAARAQTRSIHEDVSIARGRFRPVAGLTAETGVRSVTANPGNSASGIESTLGIRVAQDLFLGFQTVNATRAAEASVRAQHQTLLGVEQSTLLDAITAFADVVQNKEILALNQSNLDFLDEQVRASKDRFAVGEGTQTDISQAKAERQSALAQLLTSKANLSSAEATFQQVTGLAARNLLKDLKISPLLPKSLNAALGSSANNHPDILAAKHSIDVAAFNVKEQEGALLPRLSVEGNISSQFNPIPGAANRVDSASVIGRLTVPIYQGGIASAQIRQSKELLGQARINLDVARDRTRALVVSTWYNLLSANASIRAAQSGVQAAKLAVDGVIAEHFVGQRTRLDILEQQRDLITAQITLARAHRNQMVFAYTLISAVGRLNAQHLNLRVARHNPTKHYRKVRDKWLGLRTPAGQ